ncbi:MAG TPA: Cof-type HAD-IIB family hydrolase [Bacteroidaceae bacterium]|nr:Cof-type HAD-IIB family hydrolase [Bacteroidaceae bacterium]
MDYKLLVLDLDGTLTNSKKEITPQTLDVLLELQESGMKIALASGRPLYGITPLAEQLKLSHYGGYILAFNGGHVVDCRTKEIIHAQRLEQDLMPWLYGLASQSDTTILTYDGPNIVTETPEDQYVQHEVFLTKMTLKKVESFADYVSYNPEKCMIVGEPDKLPALENIINQEAGHKMAAYRSEPFFLELVPKGIDKALSLERLLKHISLTPDQMVAVGDGYNDLSMIKYAGLGVAMGNAQDVVKEAAQVVTLSNEEDGVAYLIKKYLMV